MMISIMHDHRLFSFLSVITVVIAVGVTYTCTFNGTHSFLLGQLRSEA